MKKIKNQILASTRFDSQGEYTPKEVLDSFCSEFSGKRMPFNQQHDMSLKSPGYIENLQVVPNLESPGDWLLIGDVYYDPDTFQGPMNGFSISFLDVIRGCENTDMFKIYLPYPYYNDSILVDELFEEGYLSVGRWVKKAADPTTTALLVSAIVFVIKPIWEDLYKTQIAPHIYKFFSTKFSKLREKNMCVIYTQRIQYEDYIIDVLIIPIDETEESDLNIDILIQAMKIVYDWLINLSPEIQMANKIYLNYDNDLKEFKIYRIEHVDGTLTER